MKRPKTIRSHPLNTDIDILQILDFIEEKAKKSGIKRVQWQKKDLIFTYITIENLKNAYLQQQRKLKIVLIDPIKEVSDPLEREKILRDAHINSQTNQRYNRTQTITRLQSQFYWKCMTLHAGLFLKACEICNKNKTRNKTHSDKMKKSQIYWKSPINNPILNDYQNVPRSG